MAKVTLDLNAFDKLTERAAENGLRAAVGEYEVLVKAVLNRPGTGRQYGKHRASSPGQPPAPDLGNLRANTNADPAIREDGEDLVGRIVANSAYAKPLHVGTERTAARPFLDVPANESGDRLTAAFVRGAKA